MKRDKELKHCNNCGAPVTTEICPYCHAATGISTWQADMEYPVIDCKEANIGFWTVWFPMIFAVTFSFFGIVFPIITILIDFSYKFPIILACSIFALVGIVSFIIGIKPLIRYLIVKTKGKLIEGTIYGYIDDGIILNGVPAQTVKILVNTNDGPKFILYQLGDIKQPYKINNKINLKVYKDIFLIDKEKNDFFS